MNIQQRCFTALIPMIFMLTFSQAAFANPIELSLDDSIALALQNNHDIKYAQSSREKSYWAVEEAKKNKGVSLDYSHISERYKTAPTVSTPAYTYTTEFDNSLSLSLPIYSGNELESKIDQAKLSLKVAEMDIDLAKQQLKLDVVTDYFTVLEYRNEVQVDQDTVNNYVDHLNLVKTKYDLGLVAKTDVLSSQVNLATAQNNLIKAQNNYNNAMAALNNAIGLSHDTELKLKDSFQYEKYSQTLEECIEYAKKHRLELAQYDANIASAQYDVKIAKSGYLPTVDLAATEDWNDTHLPGAKNNNWTL
jgi:outer membrane protein TolC